MISGIARSGITSESLPEVPDSVLDEEGNARFGTYRGTLEEVVLPREGRGALRHLLSGLFKRKRWIYTFVATPEVIALYAIVDLGYASNSFALVADPVSRSILFDRGFTGLATAARVTDFPAAGLEAKFRASGAELRAEFSTSTGEPQYRQHVQTDDFLWLGELIAKGPPALTVISPVADGGRVNVTQKWAALEARGMIEVAGRSFDLKGGVGGIDYTNGTLARHTAWRWAFACGTMPTGMRIGLNLVEGFNDAAPGSGENALFIGDELVPIGRAHFSWNKDDVLAPWRCTTDDGAVDVEFQPMGAHRESRDLRIVRSHFVQPVGHFSGTLRAQGHTYHVDRLAGVTEDQDIVW